MESSLKSLYTRFRAYQLGSEGSSFSYFDGNYFTLIEARLTDVNRPSIENELEACRVRKPNCLHITSWDVDHCGKNDLEEILEDFSPSKVEYPGYEPHTDTAKECLKIIKGYKRKNSSVKVQPVDPPYIKSLDPSKSWGYKSVIYHPKHISEESNNNSTVKVFRTGCFNVASLGDVESPWISAYLKNCPVFSNEIDILILAHHGADNGFTTKAFLRKVRPTIAVCSSNYDNQHEHPKQNIRDMLYDFGIPLYTTKTGDIIVVSLQDHTKKCRIYNLKSNSEKISSTRDFISKKSKKLGNNRDTVRDIFQHKRNPFKKFY